MRTLFVVLLMSSVCFGHESVRLRSVKRQVTTCPNGQCQATVTRTVERSKTKTVPLSAQKIAEIKVAHAAYHGIKGHCLGRLGFGGGTFEGCGWSSSGKNVPTCVPRGGRC